MKNIVVFNSFNFASVFLGPMLNELQVAIENGNNVTYISCLQSFELCGFNLFGLTYQCDTCNSKYNKAKSHISGNYTEKKLQDLFLPEDVAIAKSFVSNNPIVSNDLKFDNFDLGSAVLSSYISKSRDKEISIGENIPYINRLAFLTLLTYLGVRRYLESNHTNQVILFNGRWDYYRAAFRAAQSLNIEVKVLEVLRPGGYTEEFINEFPHSIIERQKLIDKHWYSNDADMQRSIKASEFFVRKRAGENIVDIAYTQEQAKASLPDYLDYSKKIVVLYTSSDDEFAAIGDEYKNPFFKDQSEGVHYLVNIYGNEFTDTQLVIRMHPNLKGLNFNYTQTVLDIAGKYPNIFVEKPESTIDSYALMDVAERIIVFGSSIGFEACYWGKVVILLARTYYSASDAAYVPTTKEEIKNYLTNSLIPKPKENALKIGYYYLTGGDKATYFNHEFRKNHYFKTHNLDAKSLIETVSQKVKKGMNLKNSTKVFNT